MRFQIRSRGFGLCLVEAANAQDALAAFVASHGDDPAEAVAVSPTEILWNGHVYMAFTSEDVPAEAVAA